MKKFIIGFSRNRSPLKIGSKIIQEVEKRDFSHAYIRYIFPISGLWVVAQASHGYVNEVSWELFKQDNIVVEEYEITCTEQHYIDMITFIQSNKGKPYDKLAIICIAVKKLFHFELNVRNRDAGFICSEFSARICGIVGIEVPKELDYETPSDINTLIKRLCQDKPDVCRPIAV